MPQKLEEFKGKITSNSSPAEVAKTLSRLQEYLEKYEEHDAAKIVEDLKSNKSSGSHQDKLLTKQFVKLYAKRTEALQDIAKSVKRIQEDFVDEQDTRIKKRSLASRAKSKVVKGLNATKRAITTVKDKAQSGFDFITGMVSKFMSLKNLIPMIIGGITSVITGAVSMVLGALTSIVFGLFGWLIKIPLMLAGFIAKTVGKIVGRVALSAAAFVGGLLFKIGRKFAAFTIAGLKKLGDFLGEAWNKIKQTVSSKVSSKSAKEPKSAKSSKSSSLKSSGSSKTIKSKNSESWFKKGKEAIQSIKSKVIPKLERSGAKGVAKAVGKALTKVATKAIPIIGWGLLAYDAYHAAKKSDSLVSFGVNLLDEASGGLISLALGDTGGKSAGHYIEQMISDDSSSTNQNKQESQNSEAAKIASGISSAVLANPTKGLEAVRSAVQDIKNKRSSVTVNEMKSTKTSISSNYNSFVNQYHSHKSFDYWNSRILQGDVTVEEAMNALEGTVSPNITNTSFASTKIEEYKMIKDQAVAEAVQVAATLDKHVVNGVSGMVTQVASYSNETNINIGNADPSRVYLHRGNQQLGSYQG